MNVWRVEFTTNAEKDRNELDTDKKRVVDKAIFKVSKNPLPQSEGGYGKSLGHKHNKNLTGLYKIKLKKFGIRIVYKLVRDDEIMKITVIAAREDDEVYDIAYYRRDE